jgi:hypothetical protein
VATNASQSHNVRTGSIPQTGPPFPMSEYQRRVDAVIGKFESFGIDALAVTSNASLQYLALIGVARTRDSGQNRPNYRLSLK